MSGSDCHCSTWCCCVLLPQGVVDEARVDLAAGKSVPGILGGLVSAVDENGNRLTDAELGDNLLLILLAGHDTSSTTLTNTMANLQVGSLPVPAVTLLHMCSLASDGSERFELVPLPVNLQPVSVMWQNHVWYCNQPMPVDAGRCCLHQQVSYLCLVILQGNPYVFEKLQQEQRKLVAKRGTAITGPVLKEMVYADAVIRWACSHIVCWT